MGFLFVFFSMSDTLTALRKKNEPEVVQKLVFALEKNTVLLKNVAFGSIVKEKSCRQNFRHKQLERVPASASII